MMNPVPWLQMTNMISYQGLVRTFPRRDGEHRFVDLGSKTSSSVVELPCVVLQRVTSNEQPRRLVAASVSQDVFEKYGGFVGENHVVIIEQVIEAPILSPEDLVELLSSYAVERYFRCISGATNVSAFELNQLALPDPLVLQRALNSGYTWDEAVVKGYQFE